MAIDTGILLESGTNELEVLIFNVGGKSFGVNVAKVRELTSPTKIVPCPGQPKAMLGFVDQRGTAVPLISLHRYFELVDHEEEEEEEEDAKPGRQCVIFTEFSSAQCAFLADSVEQIVRASWTQIHPIPEMSDLVKAKATGILMIEQRLVPMVDFEWIFAEHFGSGMNAALGENSEGSVVRGEQRVYIADDSPTIRSSIQQTLVTSGYVNVTTFTNGEACWEKLQEDRDAGTLPDIVVTDIEMPLMDGLALTRGVKQDPKMGHIPVILFSSLISQDNHNKGEQVGADAQLAKPMMSEVVRYADTLIAQAVAKQAAAGTQAIS